MLAGLTPKQVNERLINVRGYAQSSSGVFNLIIWSKIQEAIPWLQFEWRNYTYNSDADNNRVKQAIDKNGICLVEVDFDGTPRTDDRHWVGYIGNQKMNDPWTGTERPTSTYSIAKGYAIVNKTGQPPTDSDGEYTQVESSLFRTIVHNSTLADDTVNYLGLAEKADNVDFSTVKKSLEARDGKLTTCKNELSTREADLARTQQEIKNREEQVGRLTDTIDSQLKTHKDEVIALNKALENTKKTVEAHTATIEQLQSKFAEEAKAKGRALNDLAECQKKLELAEKEQFGDLTLGRWLSLLTTVKWG